MSPSDNNDKDDADNDAADDNHNADDHGDDAGGIGGGGHFGNFPWILSIACFMVIMLTGVVTGPVMVNVQTSILERISDCASDKPGVLKCAPRAANYLAISNAVCSVFSFLLAPYYGGLSDRWGRKPFVCIGLLNAYLPKYFLLGSPSSLLPFYVTHALGGLVPSAGMIMFSMIADVVPQGRRLESYSRIMAILLIVAAVGSALSVKLIMVMGDQGVLRAGGIVFATAFFLFPFLVGETLGSLNEAAPRIARRRSVARILALFDTTEEAQWYRWFFWLVIFSEIPLAGLGTISGFFIRERYGLASAGFSLQSTISMTSAFLWQSGGFTLLRRCCPNQGRILQVVMLLNVVHFFPYIFISAQWAPFAAASLAGPGSLQGIILRSIVTDLTDASSQGRISGILDACGSISTAIGPVLVSHVYSFGSLHGFPQLAFVFVTFGMLPSVICLASFIVLPASIPPSLMVISQKMAENLKASRKPLLS